MAFFVKFSCGALYGNNISYTLHWLFQYINYYILSFLQLVLGSIFLGSNTSNENLNRRLCSEHSPLARIGTSMLFILTLRISPSKIPNCLYRDQGKSKDMFFRFRLEFTKSSIFCSWQVLSLIVSDAGIALRNPSIKSLWVEGPKRHSWTKFSATSTVNY